MRYKDYIVNLKGCKVMSEVLLFSDIHFHKKRLEDCSKTLEWVFDTAKQRNIQDILFGGDLLHDRQKIDVYTYQKLYEILQKNTINLWLLLGNHDLWFNDNTNISSVIPFSSISNVKVIDKPCQIKINDTYWDFIPFTHNPLEALKSIKSDYCLGHLAIDGAILHGNSVTSEVIIESDGDMVTISPDLFKKYKNVFLGHYHASQIIDNIEYIGSPLELNFGETKQKKHIIIFDTKTREKTYIENTFSPKHLILKETEMKNKNLDGNFVKLIVDDISATDLIQMRKEIAENHKLGSLEIKQQKKKLDEHVIQDAKAILYKEEEMMERYLDEVGCDNLDRNTLLKVGKKICERII